MLLFTVDGALYRLMNLLSIFIVIFIAAEQNIAFMVFSNQVVL
jgi:hypothetical protein